MKITELDTPSLILDMPLFERNIIAMRDFAAASGKQLRPHAKTHKCPEIAKLQLKAGNCAGVCAAKLSEAEALAKAGIQSILITSPVTAPWKIGRVLELNRKIANLQVVVDNPEQVEMLAGQGTAEHPLGVLVDLDPEMGRTGVPFQQGLEFARLVAAYPALRLDGVQCYAGHLQHVPEFARRAQETMLLMKCGAAVFRAIRYEFPGCRIFTGAGTGTSPADLMVPEVTDIQVGSYCMMDAEYLAVEHGGPRYAPALRMLASVISRCRPREATIDAGTKAIYVTPGAEPRVWKGGRMLEGCRYSWDFGDEHGHLIFDQEQPGLKPGDRLELVVSHCDPTVNLHNVIWPVRDGEVLGAWDIALRGCCQ